MRLQVFGARGCMVAVAGVVQAAAGGGVQADTDLEQPATRDVALRAAQVSCPPAWLGLGLGLGLA